VICGAIMMSSGDSGNSLSQLNDNMADKVHYTPTQSELLCFISQKSKTMTVDDIGKICTDFYREEEIFAAKSILEQVLSNRLPKRQGVNKCRATVDDMIKVILDPNMILPTYYAADLNRIPPVDSNHCDVAAILIELQCLRTEVRAVRQLSEELTALRQEVLQLRQLKSEVAAIRQDCAKLADSEFPPLLAVGSNGQQVEGAAVAAGSQLFTDHARQLKDVGIKQLAGNQRSSGLSIRKPVRKPVIGASTSNKRLASVKTFRSVEVFVSRLHPSTASQELIDCVNEVKGNLPVKEVKCTKLKSRYEHLYASFCVSVCVDANVMKEAVDVFLSAESWPVGVLVRRYFLPKNG